MGGAYMCPFTADGIREAATNNKFPYEYKPGGPKSYQWRGIGGYNLFWSRKYYGSAKSIEVPMIRIGQKYRWHSSSGDSLGNVIAADQMSNGQYSPNANHPPEKYPSNIGLNWIWKNGLKNASGGNCPSATTGPAWYFGSWQYSSVYPTSASYLFDDGSVQLETEMRNVSSELARTGKSHLFPARFFTDAP